MNAAMLARDAADLIQNPEFLWLTGALVATLLIGAFVLSRVERWRKQQLSDSPASDVEQLSNFRAMYENGELSKEEYDRIKAKEVQRLRDKVGGKNVTPAPAGRELPTNPRASEKEAPPTAE